MILCRGFELLGFGLWTLLGPWPLLGVASAVFLRAVSQASFGVRLRAEGEFGWCRPPEATPTCLVDFTGNSLTAGTRNRRIPVGIPWFRPGWHWIGNCVEPLWTLLGVICRDRYETSWHRGSRWVEDQTGSFVVLVHARVRINCQR
jgi:hypothetical protein